ncbi:putative plant lipid transfer protein/Par allergen [Medicago truncatula]|uniref:Putative plant lipid transfer protein/Par allergen n=1 Tax=Medicago truncatula TaxID=3880 RepID=A0A396K084_MEDTR|nr:non-specific lipid transfer protein GPI-anchored 5 [Medicago truncatula]RHN80167.1 putative plant lipid transfer protein/Par allergen [Medicago truncatula]
MAFKGYILFLVMVLVANMCTQNEAQSGCTSTITSLSPCLNYIMGSSSNPSSSCCSQLSSVVQSSPQCLCSLLNGGGSSFGITINQTLALSLPSACKVQTPPVSQCKGGNGQTSPTSSTSPAGSPVDSPTESPEGAITPSANSDFPSGGAGSKSIPSTDGGSSNGSTIEVSFNLFLSLLAIVFCVITKF